MKKNHITKKMRPRIITWVAAFVIGFYSIFVLQQFWNWFATPILYLPPISFWGACGLTWLIGFIVPTTGQDENKKNFSFLFSLLEKFCISEDKLEELHEFVKSKTDDLWGDIVFQMAGKVFTNTFALIVGWSIHKFLI